VKWTGDGAERLREKRQRYTSPAFYQDEDTGRVKELINVAICAMPATHGIAPLVAASARNDARRATSAKARACGYVALAKARATTAIARSKTLRPKNGS
jgi:phage I-like protein